MTPTNAEGRCPICGKESAPKYRPFCSLRCADVDLNRWLSGVYRIPTNEAPPDDVNTDATPTDINSPD